MYKKKKERILSLSSTEDVEASYAADARRKFFK